MIYIIEIGVKCSRGMAVASRLRRNKCHNQEARERRHKRELRLESAQEATKIVASGQSDLERT